MPYKKDYARIKRRNALLLLTGMVLSTVAFTVALIFAK